MKTEEGTRRESASFFKELGGFMRPYRALYSLSVIISILSVFLNICGYILAGKIVVELFESTVDWSQIVRTGIVLALCKLGSGITMNLSTWLSHLAAFNTLRDKKQRFLHPVKLGKTPILWDFSLSAFLSVSL